MLTVSPLQVYLDVKYALDPEIKFPIVILPALQGPDEGQSPAYPAYGYTAYANSDVAGGTSFFETPTALVPSAPPPPYDTYGMYPSLTGFSETNSIFIMHLLKFVLGIIYY